MLTTSLYGGQGPFPGALAVASDLGEADAPARILSGPLQGPVIDVPALAASLEG